MAGVAVAPLEHRLNVPTDHGFDGRPREPTGGREKYRGVALSAHDLRRDSAVTAVA